ncbi:imidazole glycerol phosphate synthase subunit HisH [bacterium]|nr:imidazole glycerol phosphate synthase subunit HisH [bacterium]
MSVAVVDYGVGNLNSILNMLKRLGIDGYRSHDKDQIRAAHGLILPGVGHFDACLQNFTASGLREVVEDQVVQGAPVLGICVGAQMMTRGSQEGVLPGLGWVNADTVKFQLDETELKVPHMGWSDLSTVRASPLWRDLPEDPRFYFAHSYHFKFDESDLVIGQANYGYDFPCAFSKGNVFGIQFHPEKSHRFGMKVLENFASLSFS